MKLGVRLILPALVIGAVWGGLVDLLLWDGARYVMAWAGLVIGPAGFALAINALERREMERAGPSAQEMEAAYRAEVARRMAAAEARGDLVRFRR
ncbi:hypothetical protein JQC91_09925 [Jannaschia sp. Os4]|uniref:hypothetical protein n=1 Tax=Jannaschia sp. Os4 TaxID=2807617 RepID=UPI00193A2403|nr:hypothetical protein [Jannaschia sp. Os4]MBM2576622.1 hypothetical protein [Jannaschia sp. Os4]